jgi:type I restriction enzyme R subunit
MITENQLEQLCLDWFRTGGYAYGPDIAFDGDTPELRDYQQTVLTGRLLTALQQINPHIPFAALEEAALAVTKPETPVLLHNNRPFHRLPSRVLTVGKCERQVGVRS